MSLRSLLPAFACLLPLGCGGTTQATSGPGSQDSGAVDAPAPADAAIAFDGGCDYGGCPASQTCDPTTEACQTPCSTYPGGPPTTPCPSGYHCEVVQPVEAEQGSCFKDCDPAVASSCPTGFVCGGGTVHTGCVRYVPQGLGATCDSNEFVVDCQMPETCFQGAVNAVCAASCDAIAANPGCPAGLECASALDATGMGYCVTASFVGPDPAPLGGACTRDASGFMSRYCGSDGLAFRGTCSDNGTDNGTCIKLCRTNGDCSGSLTCQYANGPDACR